MRRLPGPLLFPLLESARGSLVRLLAARSASGAGVVWHSDGWIVRNAHVLSNGAPAVELDDGRRRELIRADALLLPGNSGGPLIKLLRQSGGDQHDGDGRRAGPGGPRVGGAGVRTGYMGAGGLKQRSLEEQFL